MIVTVMFGELVRGKGCWQEKNYMLHLEEDRSVF